MRKREVRRLKKLGLWKTEKQGPKLTKNHDQSRPFNCECCGRQWFHRYGSTSRFCSPSCSQQHKRNQWLDCSRCLAGVGLGAQTASRLLGADKSSINRAWKKHGIKARKPGGNRSLWIEARSKVTREKKLIKKWEKAWLAECKPARYPDWSVFWYNHKASIASGDAYRAMTPEQRRERNKRAVERRIEKLGNEGYKRYKSQQIRKWKERNPHKAKEYLERYLSDPGNRIAWNMRNRFKDIMKDSRLAPKGGRWEMIGTSSQGLREHLESQFYGEMTWDNYGSHWHVDHIIPVSSWDHNDPEQVRRCWHWTNLQPLTASENMSKGATITEPQMSLGL